VGVAEKFARDQRGQGRAEKRRRVVID
jgi:hypothetical protein